MVWATISWKKEPTRLTGGERTKFPSLLLLLHIMVVASSCSEYISLTKQNGYVTCKMLLILQGNGRGGHSCHLMLALSSFTGKHMLSLFFIFSWITVEKCFLFDILKKGIAINSITTIFIEIRCIYYLNKWCKMYFNCCENVLPPNRFPLFLLACSHQSKTTCVQNKNLVSVFFFDY